jgi:UPF0042 nucleotide-binding protein
MTSEPGRQLLIVTGLSGSGISTAIRALEDCGAFCVDNLPPPLIPKLLELADSSDRGRVIAVGMDARSVTQPPAVLAMLDELRLEGWQVDVLFMEANDDVLLRRFSTTRRSHPLARADVPLTEAIRAERQTMHPFREGAIAVLDTSGLNVHECKRRVVELMVSDRRAGLSIAVLSFGFKHGVPTEADIMWDVRFLPNPHFIPELRPHTGLVPVVRDFVLERPETRTFLERFLPLVDAVLPCYEQEGKSYLTIAIGCTGGRHRSVALAETLAAHLRAADREPMVRHRDMHKEPT